MKPESIEVLLYMLALSLVSSIMEMCNEISAFECVDKILKCNHKNESF